MYTKLFQQRPFRLYLIGSVASNVGDVIAGLGFLYAAYELTGSKALTTAIAIAEVLPYLLFGLIGGAISDILPKLRMMFWLDVGRAALQGLTCLLFITGTLHYVALLAIVFLIQLCGCFFNPAARAIVPETVDEQDLTAANSLLSIGNNIASIAAPAITGIILAFGSLTAFFIIDAFTYLLSAVSLFLMSRSYPQTHSLNSSRSSFYGPRDMFRQISHRLVNFWKYLKTTPEMVALFFSTFIAVFFSTWAWQVGLLFKAGIASTQGRQFFSFLLAVYAIVGILVSIVLPYMARVLTFRHYILGVFWWGLGLTALAAANTAWAMTLCVVAVGIAFALTSQSRVYLLQTRLPKTLIGQGFSFAAVMLYFANIVSLSLFGFLSEHLAMSHMFLLAGIPLLISVPVMLLLTYTRTAAPTTDTP